MKPAKVGIAVVVLVMMLAAACGDKSVNQPVPPPPPGVDPWVVGLLVDSLTPAAPLYKSPWWALYIVVVGSDAAHSGISNQGSVGRQEAGRLGRCLGSAGQLVGERQLAYVAIGDTLYSSDSAAYWAIVNRIAQGADSLRPLVDSAVSGTLRARIPGLVALSTGLFNPTTSIAGRGATPETAILRRWTWTDGGNSFAEDTSHAGLAICGLQ